MKDIPIFTVPDGMATLILREIPTRREGYVLVRAVFTTLDALLCECERFCRAAGAETVYFGGNADFSAYPVYARLVEREIDCARLPRTTASARPVAKEERAEWERHYRERFQDVPLAQSAPKLENACFIVENGERIGLGQVEGETLRVVASLKKGCGADCVAALAAASGARRLKLLCAEENLPAMRLYDRLGFTVEGVREIWYRRVNGNAK